jgi:hypothetical protein
MGYNTICFIAVAFRAAASPLRAFLGAVADRFVEQRKLTPAPPSIFSHPHYIQGRGRPHNDNNNNNNNNNNNIL